MNTTTDLGRVLTEIAENMARRSDRGEIATYIPELGRIDPKSFGIAVVDANGNIAAAGDSDTPFSIQSVSKVFTLTLALGKAGDRLWRRVGREPSGSAFNSIVQLEYEQGIPRNPFINAGAFVVADVILAGHRPREALGEILRFVHFLTGDPTITIDKAVAASEQRTGFRNRALANYMRAFGVLENPVDYTLGVYFHHCAIAMSCRQLALAGRYLVHHGRNPATKGSVVSAALTLLSAPTRCGDRLEFDTSRFESWHPSQPPGSLAEIPRHSENRRYFRGLATTNAPNLHRLPPSLPAGDKRKSPAGVRGKFEVPALLGGKRTANVARIADSGLSPI
jgi:glutaminase